MQTAEKFIFSCCLIVIVTALVDSLLGGRLGGQGAEASYFLKHHILTAPYMSPANFSFLIGTGGLLSLGAFLYGRKRVYILMYLFSSGIVFYAFTRIAMMGFVVGSALCVLLLVRARLVRVALPIALLLAFCTSFFIVDSLKERMFVRGHQMSLGTIQSDPGRLWTSITTSGRTLTWDRAYSKFFEQSPLVGKGIGSIDIWLRDNGLSRLHSEYLRIACELGFFGLLLYVLALGQILSQLVAVYRRRGAGESRKYAGVAVGALVFYAITLLTDNSLDYVTEFGGYVFSLAGFAVAAEHIEKSSVRVAQDRQRIAPNKGEAKRKTEPHLTDGEAKKLLGSNTQG